MSVATVGEWFIQKNRKRLHVLEIRNLPHVNANKLIKAIFFNVLSQGHLRVNYLHY